MNSKATLGLTAGALVVGLLAGVALGHRGSDKTSEATGPGPTKTVDGVGVGYQRSRDGAARAALAYEAALIKAGLNGNAGLLRVIADPSRSQEIGSAMKPGLEAVQAKLSQGDLLRSSALGYKVSQFESNAAVIDIWEVGVISSLQASPQAGWTTTSLQLRWVANDWKLADAPSTKSGPTPQQAGTATATADFTTFEKDLRGVDDVPTP